MFNCASKVFIGVSEFQNDDRVLIGQQIIDENVISLNVEEPFLVAAVCDGVGGMVQGFKAAEITLKLLSFINRPDVDVNTIRITIEEANKRVVSAQKSENCENGMRTTISGVYVQNERMYVFNAGDSRTYRFRYKYLTQLSKDNSLVQDMIDLGEITPEEAVDHPKRNIINKCIGNDILVQPKIQVYDDFYNGDIIAVCSDGISDFVSDADLQNIIFTHKSDSELSECCNLICQKAIEEGSKDNMSILLIRKDDIDNG